MLFEYVAMGEGVKKMSGSINRLLLEEEKNRQNYSQIWEKFNQCNELGRHSETNFFQFSRLYYDRHLDGFVYIVDLILRGIFFSTEISSL